MTYVVPLLSILLLVLHRFGIKPTGFTIATSPSMVWPLSVSLISSPALRSHPFFGVTWFSPRGHPATPQTWAASSCLGPKAFACISLVEEYVFLQDSLCASFHVAHISLEKLSLAALSKNIPPYPCHPLIPMTLIYVLYYILPCGSAGKQSTCNVGDLGSIRWEDALEKGTATQYSVLENSMNCIVHGVAKSWTRLSDFHFSHLNICSLVPPFFY